MPHQIDTKIIEFINEHHVLTLATCSNNQPYCSNCFYTYLEKENILIFSSDETTKHIHDVRINPKVAASIVLETKTIGKIQGIQLSGNLIEAKEDLLKKAKKAYLKSFPYAILMNTQLWILEIEFIKMTDNRLGFGKKLIWNKKVSE